MYKSAKQRDDEAALVSSKRVVTQSRVETAYIQNEEKMRASIPGFDEQNDHFKGVMYYKVGDDRSIACCLRFILQEG